MRANEFAKNQILAKIERDNERCEQLRQQKMELVNARRDARDQGARLKESMTRKFELMSRQSDIDVSNPTPP